MILSARAERLIGSQIARWKCTVGVAENLPPRFIITDTTNPDDFYVTGNRQKAATLMARLHAPQPLCPRPSDDDVGMVVQILDDIEIDQQVLMRQRTLGD